MGNRLPPVVGNWYSHRDKGALFQVVALDEEAGTVEIQEFDGYTDMAGDEATANSLENAITTWEQIVEDDDFDEPIH